MHIPMTFANYQHKLPFLLHDGRIPVKHRGDPWYDDGSIILLAGSMAFKVYKGILVRRSALFKRMLELDIPENTVASLRAENCLVVQTNHHEHDLSKALLLTNAGFEAWPLPEFVEFDALAPLLQLSATYELNILRAVLLRPLFRHHLMRAELYEEWDGITPLPDPLDPVRLINFARETSLHSLIPIALVDLALFVPESALLAAKEPRRKSPYAPGLLDEHDEAMCATLREYNVSLSLKLRRMLQGLDAGPSYSLKPQRTCDCRFKPLFDHIVAIMEHRAWGGSTARYHSLIDIVAAVRRNDMRINFCPNCLIKIDAEVMKMYRSWWQGVPNRLGFFGQELKDFIIEDLRELQA
ncbi:hypothetical protein EW146_g7779 [Bondarzewia mesenterica]|uniref:BTB domain-containing protein n=1 Tax=Bondarzewia mesenterica TaxID=1095465 RepID=A0A4S4LK30_9AGAM|nr:hypothetical protein EW146_g7779 [Bondarzewia mesenterica]